METPMNIERYKLPVLIAASLHGALFLCMSETTAVAIVPPEEKRVLPPLPPETLVMEPDPSEMPQSSAAGGGAKPLQGAPDIPPLSTDAPFTVTISPEVPVFDPVKDLKDFRGGLPGPVDGIGDFRGARVPDVSRLDRIPRAMVQPSPAYPDAMRRGAVNGSVTVSFVVDRDGRVIKADVVHSTHREFEESAVRAVLRWRFEPGMQNGRKVSFRMSVPIEFNAES
jgi:periplasmic protein TonB